MCATHFDSCAFLRKLRIPFRKFAIEQKRNVGVETFLQSEQALIGPVPWFQLVHYEHGLIRLRVMRDHVDHADAVFTV